MFWCGRFIKGANYIDVDDDVQDSNFRHWRKQYWQTKNIFGIARKHSKKHERVEVARSQNTANSSCTRLTMESFTRKFSIDVEVASNDTTVFRGTSTLVPEVFHFDYFYRFVWRNNEHGDKNTDKFVENDYWHMGIQSRTFLMKSNLNSGVFVCYCMHFWSKRLSLYFLTSFLCCSLWHSVILLAYPTSPR